ncbi:MAG: hypothetical protein Q9215_001698 [Flavoplaca cf. flavocitrina]
MHAVRLSLFLASLSALVTASPVPQDDPPVNILKRRRTHNCNQKDELKNIEAQAWADAGALAKLAKGYDNGNDLQPAMDLWMGADSVKSENFWKIQSKASHIYITSFADLLSGVLENEDLIHNPNWIFPEAVVEIYCGDTHPDKKKCRLQTNPKDPKGPKVTAFASAWVERGTFYNTYNVVLCPRFFKEKRSLESLLKDIKDGKEDGDDPNTYKKAWAHTIYHELTHLDPVIARKEVWDPAYYGCPAAKLANQNGCSYTGEVWKPPKWNEEEHGPAHTLINGDSWAFFASGSYFQKALKLKEPARPLNDCGIFSGESFDNYTYFDPDEMAPDSIHEATVDRKGDTFDAKEPPQVAEEDTPPEDPPTPAIPYEAADLPEGLAVPFEDADAYFADYKPGEETEEEEPEGECLPLGSDCTSDFNACCSKACYMDKGIGALTCQGEDPPTTDPNTGPQGEQQEETPAPEPDMESELD